MRKAGGSVSVIYLQGINAMQEVRAETLEKLEKQGRLLQVKKGMHLFRAREPVESIYFQITGKSILYNLTSDGKRKILFIHGPGSLLNENVCTSKDRSFYCEALEKGTVFSVPVQAFESCMQEDYSLVKAVLQEQERKVWRLGHQLKNTMGNIYMERKLAAKIWKLQRDFGVQTERGVEINVDITITFLSDMLGAPRETASKACKLLTDKGLIEIQKKRILVREPDKLAYFYHTGHFSD